MKTLNKRYLLLLISIFLTGCDTIRGAILPGKWHFTREDLGTYTIEGEEYQYVSEIETLTEYTFYRQFDYSLINTKTNKKVTLPKDLYILTKKGLVKAKISTNQLIDIINSDRFIYNGSFYYIVDIPVDIKYEKNIPKEKRISVDKALTNCKVTSRKSVRPDSFPTDPYYTLYSHYYIVRFDKENGRFILDGAVDWDKLHSKYKDFKKAFEQKNGNGKDYSVEFAMIDSYKKFDCR